MAGKKFINAKLKGYNELQEILVEDGVFKAIAPHIDVDSDCEIEDLGGKLTLPPYVDPHIHLDYVFTARKQGATNGTGTLFEGIQRWSETKSDLTIDEIKARAIKAVKMEVSHGVQFIRTHADVTDPNLTALKALLELKEELKDIVTIQIVSFPQEGMYSYKDGDKLVEEGLKMGAELAVKYDKLIDVHCDESDDPMSRFVELLTALSIVEGIGPKTTASHTCSLGSVDNSYAFRMMKNFKKAGLNFISCPTENIYLQGRQDTYPKRRGLTRVKELYENGINVCFAQDSIQDPWYPAGNGNLMNVLDNGIHIAQMMSFEEMDNCLDLITVNGAKTMNISDIYGIEAGKPANFIVVDARSEFEAVCERADVVANVRNGEYLFKKAPVAFEALSEFMA